MSPKQNTSPDISVIVPVYKGANTLASSLNSIVDQNYPNLEVIVIIDGEYDNSFQIANDIGVSNQQCCFRVFTQKNIGLAGTLNRGMKLARAKYISRLDQDDWMIKDRLVKQKDFLDQNKEVCMVGTWSHIYRNGIPTEKFHKHPSMHKALILQLLFDNPFVHSSIMLRRDAILEIGGYSTNPEIQPPEDYELWSRAAQTFLVANIPEVLTVYHETENSMSRTNERQMLEKVINISANNIYTMLNGKTKFRNCLAFAKFYHEYDKLNSISIKEIFTFLKIHNHLISEINAKFAHDCEEFNEYCQNIKCHFLKKLIIKFKNLILS
jgi:glycosyltransferase involved in cell wall biosynthesis